MRREISGSRLARSSSRWFASADPSFLAASYQRRAIATSGTIPWTAKFIQELRIVGPGKHNRGFRIAVFGHGPKHQPRRRDIATRNQGFPLA